MPLRFSAWYPLVLDAVDANTPRDPGVYEVRVYGPLLGYPKGRSAMVLYGASHAEARTLRDALNELCARGLPASALSAVGHHPVYFRTATCARPGDELRRLLADFQMRFGANPVGNV